MRTRKSAPSPTKMAALVEQWEADHFPRMFTGTDPVVQSYESLAAAFGVSTSTIGRYYRRWLQKPRPPVVTAPAPCDSDAEFVQRLLDEYYATRMERDGLRDVLNRILATNPRATDTITMYTNQQVDTRAGLARLFLDKYHTLRAEVDALSAANKHLEEQLWTKVDALTVANNHLEEQLRLKSDEVAAATTQPASDVVQRLRLILEGRDD